MHPKIFPSQGLSANAIGGPIHDWEDDEAAVVFTFVISQVVGGGVAIGIGKSELYYPKASEWWAPLVKLEGSPVFQRGGATVMAWASIALDDGGWEMYPWGRPVTLT
jgi:hypothetical protein